MIRESDAQIVNQVLGEFVSCLRDRDLEGALRLFHDDALLFGSEASESADGMSELHAFFSRLFGRPQTYGWIWETPKVRGTDGVVWFVASAVVVVHSDDGGERSGPYRLSGVLVPAADGRWRFGLFNGAEPVSD